MPSSYNSDSSGPRRKHKKNRRDQKDKDRKKRRRYSSSSSEKADDEKEKSKEPLDERKRKYHSLRADKPISQEEIERYQRNRHHFDDPMRAV